MDCFEEKKWFGNSDFPKLHDSPVSRISQVDDTPISRISQVDDTPNLSVGDKLDSQISHINLKDSLQRMYPGKGTIVNPLSYPLINISNYVRRKCISESNMSIVYEAYSTLHKKPCILKMYLPESLRHAVIESNSLQALKGHPNLPKHYGLYAYNETLVLVNEYVIGTDLLNYINDFPISKDLVKHVVFELAKIISYIHSKGFVYRDIKLDNIIYEIGHGKVTLIDSGFCVPVELKTMESCGTLNYCSPEVLMADLSVQNVQDENLRKRYVKATDVWSYGCVVYVLSTYKMPFGHGDIDNNDMIKKDILDINITLSTDNMNIETVDILRKCFTIYQHRFSIDELLKCPFFPQSDKE
jgi:serine/threonine protein kinase